MNRDEMIARSGDSHLEQLFSAALWDAGWSNGLPHVARCEAVPQVKFDRATQLAGSIVLRFTHLELTRYMPACMADLKSAIELQGGRNTEAWRSYHGSRRMAPGLRVATGV